MNRERQVPIHDKIFSRNNAGGADCRGDWIEVSNSVYKKHSEDQDVNEEDDGHEDENVPFLLQAEAHLRLPNYYS